MLLLKKGQRAVRRDLLEKSFAKISLGFKLLGGPIDLDGQSREHVQLDTRDSPRFGEYVRLWPGAPQNEIEVLNADNHLRQLVLRVKEAPRKVLVEVPTAVARTEAEAARGARAVVIGQRGNRWLLERSIEQEERRFLCGHDDVRLFIAMVPPTTHAVSTAHMRLRPQAVTEAENRQPGSTVRQGEWFFIPITAAERARLEAHLGTHPRLPLRDERLGRLGRPHVADEQVVIHRFGTFARGTVRHVGHNPLLLPDWRRVLHNLEGLAGEEERRRLRWLD